MEQTSSKVENSRENIVVSYIFLEIIWNMGKNEKVREEPKQCTTQGEVAAFLEATFLTGKKFTALHQQDGTKQEYKAADESKPGNMVQRMQRRLESNCKQEQEDKCNLQENFGTVQKLGTGRMRNVYGIQL